MWMLEAGVTAEKNSIGALREVGLDNLELSPYQRSIDKVAHPMLKGPFSKARLAPAPCMCSDEGEEVRVLFEDPELVSPNGVWPVNFGAVARHNSLVLL
jgi:hypothetical protein